MVLRQLSETETYVTISSTGNAFDFGDLTVAIAEIWHLGISRFIFGP